MYPLSSPHSGIPRSPLVARSPAGWAVSQGEGVGAGGEVRTSFSWPSPTSPFSSRFPRHVAPSCPPRRLVPSSPCRVASSRRRCGMWCRGGAAPAVAVVVVVRVGVEGTWAGAAGASGAGGGGGGH